MPERPVTDSEEQIGFPGGWRGLYTFLVIYGIVQVVILYFITRALN